MTEELITLLRAAELTGIPYQKLSRLRKEAKKFPLAVSKAKKNVDLYRKADFVAFRDSMVIAGTGVNNHMAAAFLTGKIGWKPVLSGGCHANH